jgi:hypothetical protein
LKGKVNEVVEIKLLNEEESDDDLEEEEDWKDYSFYGQFFGSANACEEDLTVRPDCDYVNLKRRKKKPRKQVKKTTTINATETNNYDSTKSNNSEESHNETEDTLRMTRDHSQSSNLNELNEEIKKTPITLENLVIESAIPKEEEKKIPVVPSSKEEIKEKQNIKKEQKKKNVQKNSKISRSPEERKAKKEYDALKDKALLMYAEFTSNPEKIQTTPKPKQKKRKQKKKNVNKSAAKADAEKIALTESTIEENNAETGKIEESVNNIEIYSNNPLVSFSPFFGTLLDSHFFVQLNKEINEEVKSITQNNLLSQKAACLIKTQLDSFLKTALKGELISMIT